MHFRSFFDCSSNPERIPNESRTKDELRMNENRTKIITLYSAFNPNRSFVSWNGRIMPWYDRIVPWNDRIMPWYDVCSLLNLPFAVAVPFFDFAFADWREGPVACMHKRSFQSVPIPVMSRAKTMSQVKSAFLLIVGMSLQIRYEFSGCNSFFIHFLYPFVVMWEQRS